jgi:integrase
VRRAWTARGADGIVAELRARAKHAGCVQRRYEGAARPGFGLAVTANGTASWIIKYTSPVTGKRQYETLGRWAPEADKGVSLKAARLAADQARKALERGEDPRIVREQRQVQAQAEAAERRREAALATVDDLIQWYLKTRRAEEDKRLEAGATLTENARYSVNRASVWAGVRALIGSVRARDLSAEQAAHAIHSQAKWSGNAVNTLLSAAYNLALECEADPKMRIELGYQPSGITSSPVARMKTLAAASRERVLNEAEIMWLFSEAAEALPPWFVWFTRWSLSTGQRIGEIAAMHEDQFHPDRATGRLAWVIPAAQRGKTWRKQATRHDHVVPLSDWHLDLLREMQPYVAGGYFFPREDLSGPRGHHTVSSAYTDLRKRGRIPALSDTHWQARDIRRTFKTLAASVEISRDLTDRIQGHVQGDVSSRHYNKWDYFAQKAQAMDRYVEALAKVVAGEQVAQAAELISFNEAGTTLADYLARRA